VFTFTLLKLFDSGMYLIGDLSELGTRDGSDVLAKLKDFQDDCTLTYGTFGLFNLVFAYSSLWA